MSETAKSMVFVGIGLAAVLVALVTRPSSAKLDTGELVGTVLTKKFASPDDAKRLKIVRFDEDTATLREFEVAEGQDGLWTIPSKNGYPADATQQMAESAMSLKDREILGVESEDAADHELYGVVDPLSPKLKPGEKGVGTRVSLFDGNDDPLVDLIIGKSRKDAAGQRYVREAGRDVVYVINIDPDKLSTSFEDWIEKDLLKLDAWDLKQVEIKDYSAELFAQMTPEGPKAAIDFDHRADMTLAYDDKDSQWKVEKLQSFDQSSDGYVEFKLKDDEELSAEALNGLKTALDDLKIVDVVRKPQGLSDDLKAGEDFLRNIDAQRDLIVKGFTPMADKSGSGAEIISSDGELIATMKDGTEYVLRFGNLTSGPGDGKKNESSETSADKKTPAESDVHRYLFAMARFNEDAVTRPEVKLLPELPPEPQSAEAPPQADGQPESTDSENKPATETTAAPVAEKSNSDSTDGANTEAKDTASESTDAPAKADEKSEEVNAKEKEVAAIMAERKRIEDENQRNQAEYQKTIAAGREKVQALNRRFGDWYFIVDNDVFNKVRLGRDAVIKKKTATNGPADPAANPASLPGSAIPGLPTIPGPTQ